jgi:hypothetical protein
MKKGLLLFLAALLIIPMGAIIAGCSSSGSSGGGGGPMIGAFFSLPQVAVVKNGVNQFSNGLQPFTGEAVTDATVVVSNSNTSQSVGCVYNPVHMTYMATRELSHGTGESVALHVTSSIGDVSGGPTVTPNSYSFIAAPAASATVSVPFTISWLISAESSPASHVWLTVSSYGITPESYWAVLPVATTAYQITSSMITGKGSYYISVTPVNPMSLTGAAAGSVGYVGSVKSSPGVPVTIQ